MCCLLRGCQVVTGLIDVLTLQHVDYLAERCFIAPFGAWLNDYYIANKNASQSCRQWFHSVAKPRNSTQSSEIPRQHPCTGSKIKSA